MQEYADEIVAELQSILDKHKGSIAVSSLKNLLSKGLRDKLCIKSGASVGIVMKRLGSVVEEKFIISKKRRGTYIMTPCDPESLIMDQLSENKPVTLKELVKILQLFTKKDIVDLMTEMVNAGKVRVQFDDSYNAQFFTWGAGHQAVSERRQIHAENNAQEVQTFRPEDYTQAKFRAAYDELHKERIFVRICDLRRKLGWPREVFDGMIRTLRDNRTIQISRADESMLTQDKIRDCFIDENKTLMGLITWHGR